MVLWGCWASLGGNPQSPHHTILYSIRKYWIQNSCLATSPSWQHSPWCNVPLFNFLDISGLFMNLGFLLKLINPIRAEDYLEKTIIALSDIFYYTYLLILDPLLRLSRVIQKAYVGFRVGSNSFVRNIFHFWWKLSIFVEQDLSKNRHH